MGVLLSLGFWAPVPLDWLWVSYTSVLLGLELEAGMALLGIGPGPGPTPARPQPPVPHLLPECLVLLLQNLVLHRLRNVRHEPGSDKLDAQSHVLGGRARGGWSERSRQTQQGPEGLGAREEGQRELPPPWGPSPSSGPPRRVSGRPGGWPGGPRTARISCSPEHCGSPGTWGGEVPEVRGQEVRGCS